MSISNFKKNSECYKRKHRAIGPSCIGTDKFLYTDKNMRTKKYLSLRLKINNTNNIQYYMDPK